MMSATRCKFTGGLRPRPMLGRTLEQARREALARNAERLAQACQVAGESPQARDRRYGRVELEAGGYWHGRFAGCD